MKIEIVNDNIGDHPTYNVSQEMLLGSVEVFKHLSNEDLARITNALLQQYVAFADRPLIKVNQNETCLVFRARHVVCDSSNPQKPFVLLRGQNKRATNRGEIERVLELGFLGFLKARDATRKAETGRQSVRNEAYTRMCR